jgi:phospholipid/cholesterol/gamma-HCH transport system ATP-binding protein
MNRNDPILEFTDVTIASSPLGHAGLSHVNARFLPGTLSLIQVEPGNEQLPFADLAEGLLCPEEGRVMFQGEAWTAMPPEQALQRRAQIGRVFDGHGWISNLNVNENVTLSQRHHTWRPVAEILAEAEARARAFGLSELPKTRPALVSHQDLRRAEWIRAFLGRPLLVLLERPMRGVPLEHVPRLISAVREACAREAVVLWLTDNDAIERHLELPPAARYAMRGLTMAMVKNG